MEINFHLLAGRQTPLLVGFRSERQVQRSPRDDFLMGDPATVQRLAVERGGLNINILRRVVARGDGERAGLRILGIKANRHLVKKRAEDLIARIAGTGLMDSTGGEDKPGRHLTDILVAAESVGTGLIGVVNDTNPSWVSQGAPARLKRKGNQVNRLVWMIIVRVPLAHVGSALKEVSQFCDEHILAAKKFDQAGNVLGNRPALLINGGLLDRILGEKSVPRPPVSVPVLGTEPAFPIGADVGAGFVIRPRRGGIEDIVVGLGAGSEVEWKKP